MNLKKLFFNNRTNYFKNVENKSISIFFSKDRILKGDSEFFDFCDSNFFYLTGIEQEKCKLLLYKKNEKENFSYLFIEKPISKIILYEGEKISKKKLTKISKIKEIYYLDDFEKILNEKLKFCKKIYYFHNNKIKKESLSSYEIFIKKIKRKYKKIKFENNFEIISKLRQIKSTFEIEIIKKSMKITKKAFEKILLNIKNIKNESEIEANISFIYTKNFAKHSYHPIVASSKNSCVLHYIKNNEKIKKNSLVLIDSGAELYNYKTDITRTIPKTGKFTKRQKQVYEKVLEMQNFAIKNLKIGKNRKEWEKENFNFYKEKLIELNLISQKEYEKNKKIILNFCPHSTGHFLGLDTHDLGDYKSCFSLNEVFTIEPGIYIKKENIGIRIEDNILIKKNKIEILSKNIPKKIEEIEKLILNK